jgi:membrane protein
MSTPHAAETPGRLARLVRGPYGLVVGLTRAFPRAIEDLFHDRCPQYAAAIAYRVLFSLFPLTILLVSVFGLVLQDDDLRKRVISELLSVLPVSETGGQNVENTIEQIASPLSAIGLVSLVALLWGASGMMASIRIGLEAAFKVERRRPAAHAKLIDFVLVGASGLLVLGVIGISTFAAFFSRAVEYTVERLGLDVATSPSGSFVRDGLQLVLIAVMTVMLYRFVPSETLGRRAVLLGATFTAIGIWGASKLLAVLLDFTRYNVIYGSLAGVMTFLLFVYVVAMILLLGAELAYAWSLPPGPPGPPLVTQIKNAVLGLVVRQDRRDEDGEQPDVGGDTARETSAR